MQLTASMPLRSHDRCFYTGLRDVPASERDAFAAFIRRNFRCTGRLLDIGAGNGEVLRAVARGNRRLRAIALDHNQELLKQSVDHADVIAADCRQRLPIISNSMDGVVLSHILHLLPRPCHLISETARVLRVGGQVFILTCSESDLCGRILNPFLPGLHTRDWRRYGGITRLRRDLAAFGLRLQVVESVRLGTVCLDTDFPRRLRDRCWSSLCLFTDVEIDTAFVRLRESLERQAQQGRVMNIPWIRTALAAIKIPV